MRFDTFIVSVLPSLRRRQDTGLPAECYNTCDEAATIAQATGRVSQLCEPGSSFQVALDACNECTSQYNASSPGVVQFPDLAPYIIFCEDNNPSANSAEISSYTASVGSSAAWCAFQATYYDVIPSNCSTAPATATFTLYSSTSAATINQTTSQSVGPIQSLSVATSTSTARPTPVTSTSSHSHTAAIVGGVVGGVGGLAVISLLAWFILRQRRRQARVHDQGPHEKAQLHSDDIKPDRKELEGTQGSRDMLQKKPADLSELPANEEVIDKDRFKEMPSNEPPGQEMETTENEMAALDRLARLTDSTTLGSGNTHSDGPPAS